MSNTFQAPAPQKSGKTPTTGGELENVAFFLGRAYYAYIGLLDRMLREEGLADQLQPGMGNVLFALFERDDRTISDVAARLRISKATMTGMVARIRKAGLITAGRDPVDGRAIRLKLTPLARSLEMRCRQVSRQIEDVLCSHLTTPERDIATTLLSKIIDAIGDASGQLSGK